MNATTTTKSVTTCSAEVSNGGSWSRYGRRCTHKATHFEQPRRTLEMIWWYEPVGERSELDILMGVDNRETVRRSAIPEGPVQPMPFCGTHAPSKVAERRNKKDEEARRVRSAKENRNALWTDLAESLKGALGADEFKWDVMVAYDRDFESNGVKLSGKAVRAILARLEGGATD